ncbi:hypothetical protein Plhal304r1_c009g0036301 [Plasmopara halstedii]
MAIIHERESASYRASDLSEVCSELLPVLDEEIPVFWDIKEFQIPPLHFCPGIITAYDLAYVTLSPITAVFPSQNLENFIFTLRSQL